MIKKIVTNVSIFEKVGFMIDESTYTKKDIVKPLVVARGEDNRGIEIEFNDNMTEEVFEAIENLFKVNATMLSDRVSGKIACARLKNRPLSGVKAYVLYGEDAIRIIERDSLLTLGKVYSGNTSYTIDFSKMKKIFFYKDLTSSELLSGYNVEDFIDYLLENNSYYDVKIITQLALRRLELEWDK